MDDNGILATPEERTAKLGIPAKNIVIDPLAMTMGADHDKQQLAGFSPRSARFAASPNKRIRC
jgi:cobalamin-dependent methionine synthase I